MISSVAFKVGDEVKSRRTRSHKSIKGKVADFKKEKVLVRYGHRNKETWFDPSELELVAPPPPVAPPTDDNSTLISGGFKVGDRVVHIYSHHYDPGTITSFEPEYDSARVIFDSNPEKTKAQVKLSLLRLDTQTATPDIAFPAAESSTKSSGGFKVGDRVFYTKDCNLRKAGDTGVITEITKVWITVTWDDGRVPEVTYFGTDRAELPFELSVFSSEELDTAIAEMEVLDEEPQNRCTHSEKFPTSDGWLCPGCFQRFPDTSSDWKIARVQHLENLKAGYERDRDSCRTQKRKDQIQQAVNEIETDITALNPPEPQPADQAQNPPELKVKGRAISFGWTSNQLLAGLKNCTRRTWKDSYAKYFIKAFNEGRTIPAIDKDYRYGGKVIGFLKLTCCPYKEKLVDMPESDLKAEGGMCATVDQFINKYFKANESLSVWVVRFEFQPLNPPEPNHRAQQPQNPPELKQSWASGWLEPYIKNKKLKSGIVASYPRVEGDRNPDDPHHWYWAYKYEEKSEKAISSNGCITRAVSVPADKVLGVKNAIANKWPVQKVLQFIRGEI